MMKITDDRILDGLDYLCCQKEICIGAYDLINRLQDLNKALINGQETLQKTIVEQKMEIEELYKSLDKYILEIHSQKAEIERLEEMLDSSVSSERDIVDNIGYEKAEAIKEFAERLKSIMHEYCNDITEDDIDNLVKEMTESITKIEHNSLCETETYKGGE